MAQTFNPALHDKHAEDLGEVLAADRHAKLDTGLEDSFPPPIPSAPRSRHHRRPTRMPSIPRCGTRSSRSSARGGRFPIGLLDLVSDLRKPRSVGVPWSVGVHASYQRCRGSAWSPQERPRASEWQYGAIDSPAANRK